MTREQAINSMISHGFKVEQVGEIIKAVMNKPTTKNDCEHCSKTYGTLGCCDFVSNEPVYSCKEGHEEYARGIRKLGTTTKNDLGVECISRIETIDYLCKHCPDDGECFKDCDEIKHLRQLPSVTPQLSVPEVTALAEWTEKLTKECENAYNKGYADGRKEQEPIIDKIRAEIDLDTRIQVKHYTNTDAVIDEVLDVIDKYKPESEVDNGNDD